MLDLREWDKRWKKKQRWKRKYLQWMRGNVLRHLVAALREKIKKCSRREETLQGKKSQGWKGAKR